MGKVKPESNKPDPKELDPEEEVEETDPDSEEDKGDGTEDGETKGTKKAKGKTKPEEGEESFADPSVFDDHPELKVAYQGMQSAFTKAMQGFPKKYRTKEAFAKLMKSGEAYDNLMGDDEVVALLDKHYEGGGEEKPPEKKPTKPEGEPDPNTAGMSEEEIDFFKKHRKVFTRMAREDLGEELGIARTNRDDKAMSELQTLYPDVDIDSYRKKILAAGAKYKGISYEDALLQVAGRDIFKHQKKAAVIKKKQQEEAEDQGFITGSEGDGDRKPTKKFLNKTSAEMRDGLPVHGE